MNMKIGWAGFYLLCACAAAAQIAPVAPAPVYTSIAAIRRLPAGILSRKPACVVRATVLFYRRRGEPAGSPTTLLVGQKGAAIYVVQPKPLPLRAGQQVLIRGNVNPGWDRPIITAHQIEITGRGSLPVSTHIDSVAGLLGQRHNAQWVEVEGVIREISPFRQGWILGLMNGNSWLELDVHDASRPPPRLIGAVVHAQGVSDSVYNAHGLREQNYLLVPGWRQLRILNSPPANLLSLPRISIRKIGLVSNQRLQPLIHVRGMLTLQYGTAAYLQTRQSALSVTLQNPMRPLPRCSRVDAVGFPAVTRGGRIQLRHARLWHEGPGSCPAPFPFVPRAGNRLNDHLVWLRGRVLLRESLAQPRQRLLELLAGRYLCRVPLHFAGAARVLNGISAGSEIQVTGVLRGLNSGTAYHISLIPGAAGDLVLLHTPAWWTARHLSWIVAAALLLAILIFSWNLSLQTSVRRQKQIMADQADEQSRIEAHLAEANRMEMVGRLAAGVAHDFNNLLTVIMGRIQLVQARLEGTTESGRGLNAALEASQRAARLTAQLLAYGRKQIVQAQHLDLNEIIRGSQDTLRSFAGEQVELQLHLDPGIWPIHADRAQVEQVLWNLVSNARDAMPHGGRLDISTDNMGLDSAQGAEYSGAHSGDYVRLRISDNGQGMPPEVRAHIFEPFFTTKEFGQGMGLAGVHGIMRQCGGGIRVISRPGEGACFEVLFPRASVHAVQAREAGISG